MNTSRVPPLAPLPALDQRADDDAVADAIAGDTQDRRAWYVGRSKGGFTGFVGPLTSEAGAERERDAWRKAGYAAEILPSSPAVRETVKTWQSAADIRMGRSGMRRSY